MGLSLAQTLASIKQNVPRSPDCRSAYCAVVITPPSSKRGTGARPDQGFS